MGSSMSAMYDDYDDYKFFCDYIGVDYVGIYSTGKSFRDHEKELLEKLGFKYLHDYYEAMQKAKKRDEQINSIIND